MKKEQDYIDYLSKYFKYQKNLILGPGDDCAVIKIGNKFVALTVDEIVDKTHFILNFSKPSLLASKLVRSSVSDIYSMGDCKPVTCLVSCGLPNNLTENWFKEFVKSLKKECSYFDISIAGGNMAKSTELHLAMTVIGFFKNRKIITRKGAKAGELLYAIGKMGGAKAGLELIMSNLSKYSHNERKLINMFWKPKIFKDQVSLISKFATSMLDNSDGLYKSSEILSKENNIKIIISINENFADKILIDWCNKNNKNWKEYVLNGGEDYNLIFSIKASDKSKLEKLLPDVYQIGFIEKGQGVYIENYDGRIKPFEHF